MAENPIASDVQKALEKQVAELRSELKRLSRDAAARTSELRAGAEEALDDASGRFRQAASAVRERGQAVAEVVRENPGTATTLFGTVGLVGLAVGIAIGCLISDRR